MELSVLEQKRESIRKELLSVGEMLNGTLSVRFQKCGKSYCVCRTKGHPGHGPHYSLSYYDETGKMLVRNFQPGVKLDRIKREIENYHKYKEINKKYIEVNTVISLLRSQQSTDEHQGDAVKKNSKKKS